MAPIVSHVEIARPADAVFAYVTDLARLPQWQPNVLRAGARARPDEEHERTCRSAAITAVVIGADVDARSPPPIPSRGPRSSPPA